MYVHCSDTIISFSLDQQKNCFLLRYFHRILAFPYSQLSYEILLVYNPFASFLLRKYLHSVENILLIFRAEENKDKIKSVFTTQKKKCVRYFLLLRQWSFLSVRLHDRVDQY